MSGLQNHVKELENALEEEQKEKKEIKVGKSLMKVKTKTSLQGQVKTAKHLISAINQFCKRYP